ncbi:MAG: 23S rRNA (uracil(1939)-C(5))-methyltransferase RlmD, partial [Clostridia bacterium]
MIKQEQKCPIYKKCSGCQLQNLNYQEQLLLKEKLSVKHLGKFGHVENIISMKNPRNYRNKVQAAFAIDRRKQVISGVYQSK